MRVSFLEQYLSKSSAAKHFAIGLVAVVFASGLSFRSAAAADVPKQPAVPNTTQWGGLGWGIGIATDFDVTGGRVAGANLVNNFVRVTDASSNVGISFVLEAHYFLRDFRLGLGPSGLCDPKDLYNCTELGHGPFVAIEVGDGSTATPAANGPITAYAMGWMVGLRHPSSLVGGSPTASWNFGLGLRITPKSQVLGDGIIANQPLPPGETAIRFKTEPRVGITLLSSFSF